MIYLVDILIVLDDLLFNTVCINKLFKYEYDSLKMDITVYIIYEI